MKRNFYESEKRQHFSLRKYIGIGLCSVALGSFSLVHTNLVHADTVNDAPEASAKTETATPDPVLTKQANVVMTTAPQKVAESTTDNKTIDNIVADAPTAELDTAHKSVPSSVLNENKTDASTGQVVYTKPQNGGSANNIINKPISDDSGKTIISIPPNTSG